MNVICKCGYQGEEFVEYETNTPTRQYIDYTRSYKTVNKTTFGTKTLNWACPKCGKVLVQQRGGLSYDMHEIDEMKRRLWRNSWKNERWLKASKLPPGTYEAKIVSARKVRNKNRVSITLQLKNDVEIKESV